MYSSLLAYIKFDLVDLLNKWKYYKMLCYLFRIYFNNTSVIFQINCITISIIINNIGESGDSWTMGLVEPHALNFLL